MKVGVGEGEILVLISPIKFKFQMSKTMGAKFKVKTQIIHPNLSLPNQWMKVGVGEGFGYWFSPLIFIIDFHH